MVYPDKMLQSHYLPQDKVILFQSSKKKGGELQYILLAERGQPQGRKIRVLVNQKHFALQPKIMCTLFLVEFVVFCRTWSVVYYFAFTLIKKFCFYNGR